MQYLFNIIQINMTCWDPTKLDAMLITYYKIIQPMHVQGWF